MKTLDQLIGQLEAAFNARKLLRDIPDATTSPLITLWPQHDPSAQHALELFATRHNLKIDTHVSYYGADRMPCRSVRDRACDQIRTLEVRFNGYGIASVQFPIEPVPRDRDADAAWSPAHQERQAL